MTFTETSLAGAYLVALEPHHDERGFFARTFCRKEFADYGLNPEVVQCNLSYNRFAGTLRGMHYQKPPYAEAKLVRCARGEIYDVIVDLRPNSQTYCQSFAVTLSADNRVALYVPAAFAHGFQTLKDDTEVEYQMSQSYHPEAAAGLRYNDPAFALSWPREVVQISPQDLSWPLFS